MRTYKFYQVNVFTETQFGGNPLAVFPDAVGLSAEEMQQIAFELNLSETTFVFPPEAENAQHHVRIFTPKCELPFAGHPTIGTHYVLHKVGRIPLNGEKTRVFQEIGVGVLPVDLYANSNGELDTIAMTQAKPEFGEKVEDIELLAKSLGSSPDAIATEIFTPQVVSTGLPFLIIPIHDLSTLESCTLDPESMLEICLRHNCKEAHAFSLETLDEDRTAHARFFSGHLLFEDPATGSAAGALSAYLGLHHFNESAEIIPLTIEQGDFIRRPGRIMGKIEKSGRDIQRIEIAGRCRDVFSGEFIVEDK